LAQFSRVRGSIGFGNLNVIENGGEVWRWLTLDSVSVDVKLTIHQLRKSPVFTATVIATLAPGIGANTATFR
jgi:hypothetical protein